MAEQPIGPATNGTEQRLDALLTLGRDLLAELRARGASRRPEPPAGTVELRGVARDGAARRART